MRITQRKGDIAVAQAVATFTKNGYDVALPLTESASYDIIVDTGRELKRVQVRYAANGQTDLRRIHSNSTGYVVKKPKAGSYDWLYVLTSDSREYLVRRDLSGRRSVKPNDKDALSLVLRKYTEECESGLIGQS
ncbi:MAG: group I intron-associated PD-(D/E)XK endonuclease [Patescibacteria group bacterium]|nr:group I intron-associated PD-(D/E)XK endonuclease [Patescibacteria group bacterium]